MNKKKKSFKEVFGVNPRDPWSAKYGIAEEELDEGSLHDWFGKEKWVRMDTKGNIKGKCARDPGEGKPKCLPRAKAQALGKEKRATAARRKRREDPNASRSGKAINVKTEEIINYINEKKDACYHKVKSRYKVWPSAYASGALVRCRKAGAKNWGTKSEEAESKDTSKNPIHHTADRASELKKRVQSHKPEGTIKTEQLHTEPYEQVKEKWSAKYKSSINCSNPKGFSQKAHCAGRKKRNESVMHDEPEGTLTKVTERRRHMSKAARIIKSIYKKKGMREELYDHEKDKKDPARMYGKKPTFEKADKDDNKGENKPQAAAVLKGGKTMTGQERDTIEIDPMMRNRPGQPDITKDKDKKKNDKSNKK